MCWSRSAEGTVRISSILLWGILEELVIYVLMGHPNFKIVNSMKLVNFVFVSSLYHVFELKNIEGNLIALPKDVNIFTNYKKT